MTNSTYLAINFAEGWHSFWHGDIGAWLLTRGLRITLFVIGALLAVPVLAFLNSAIRVLVADDPDAVTAAQEADDGPVISAEPDDVEQS